jgi:hypothetical protein
MSIFGSIETSLRARRNRRRHPDLLEKYSDAEGEDKIVVAQEMLMRDRELERAKHGGASGPNYPRLGDYYQPPIMGRLRGFIGDYWRMMRGHGLS